MNQPKQQAILFTWSKCKQCQDLKRALQTRRTNIQVYEYDLDNIQSNQNLMNIFNRVSPKRNVPALAVINGNSLVRGSVGMNEIAPLLWSS